MEWFGQAKIDFVHAPAPRKVREKDGEETDLLKICEKTTPPCSLNPLLFNGHLQAWWTSQKPWSPDVYFRRRTFHSDHELYSGSFAVDFAVPRPHGDGRNDPTLPPNIVYFTEEEWSNIASDDTRPMFVILHGLSGGAQEPYVRHALAPMVGEGGGWEACVVTFRGCSKAKLTSGMLYNGRATWDLRQVVKWLRKTFPNRPLFGLGFSLGANILTNYCGEEGEACVFKACLAIATPYNMEASSKALKRTFLGRVYLESMGGFMKQLISNNRPELEKYTDLDLEAIMNIKYLYEFDRELQCHMWGYATEDCYYRDASSAEAILAIRIPFIGLHAKDDPIVQDESIPYQEFQQNPNTVLVTTSLGSHMCWFETGGTRWHSRIISSLFNHLASKTDLDSLRPSSEPAVTKGTWGGGRYTPMARRMAMAMD